MSNALRNVTAAEKIHLNTTNQRARTPGREDEVKNNAGGFVFQVSDKSRLERFLILGTDGGTYYVGEKTLTKANMDFVKSMIVRDENLVRETMLAVSKDGRAFRNSPALFTLAALLVWGQDKAATKAVVNEVARTSTHLFEFAEFIENLGGWGRSKKAAVAAWYTSRSVDDLAYQVIKYRQRNGWTHRDLFRLAHPKGVDARVGTFILKGENPTVVQGDLIDAFHVMQSMTTAAGVVKVLEQYKNLPWETIPTQFLKDPKVWKTLFYNKQLNGQALVRNIVRLARIDAFKDMVFAADYAARLVDPEMIRRTRLHPINFLNAAVVFKDGQVDRSGGFYYSYGRKKDWTTSGVIYDALNEGFHVSFGTMEPAMKRTLIGLDVSGSMACNANGLDLTCAQVGAAVAMTVARTEPYHMTRGFSYNFVDLGITPKMSLTEIIKRTAEMTFGSTDASLPMVWAKENRVEVDTFVVITDNETWAGIEKPFQALKKYRDSMGIPARLAVLGVAATPFTIADPTDSGMMDFVGFDSAAPRVLTDFSAGRV